MGKTRNHTKLRVGLALATIAGVAGTHASLIAADQEQWAAAEIPIAATHSAANTIPTTAPVVPEIALTPTGERPKAAVTPTEVRAGATPTPTMAPTATPTPAPQVAVARQPRTRTRAS